MTISRTTIAGVVLASGLAGAATVGAAPVAVRFAVRPPLPGPAAVVWLDPRDDGAGAGQPREWPFTGATDGFEHDVVVVAEAGRSVAVLIGTGDGGYVVVGPLRWPTAAETVVVPNVARRTIRVHAAGPLEGLSWVDGSGAVADWPSCRRVSRSSSAWLCYGVPVDLGGVLVGRALTGWSAAPVPSAGDPTQGVDVTLAPVTAGALLVVDDGEECEGRMLHRRESSVLAGTRYADVTEDARVDVAQVDGRTFWVASRGRWRPDAFARITCRGGTARVEATTLDAASPFVPWHVAIVPDVTGRVTLTDGGGHPAAGAALEVFAPRAAGAAADRAPRWERLASHVAGGNGVVLLKLPRGRYELRAYHAQLGTAAVVEEWKSGGLTIALRAARRVSGRIVQNGNPVTGVVVRAVPALEAVVGAADTLDLLVPPASTGADGRFLIAVPARIAELRIGDDAGPVRRVPLPPGTTGEVLELGDIALSASIGVAVSVQLPGACELVAAGPLGRTGLAVLRATRTGPTEWRLPVPEPGVWLVSGACAAAGEVALLPSTIEVPADVPEWQATLVVRPP